MTGWTFRGIIEGFYGPPWSWEARADVMRFAHARGMTDYLYAPKDDPLHRDQWRELYPSEVLAGFEGLVAEATLRVGYAISPGLSMDYGSADDRRSLAAKIDQVLDLGLTVICLACDDIDVRPGLGRDHAELTAWLRDHLGDRAQLLFVPTEYTGTSSTPYLDALATGVPDDVLIAWTGRAVVNDEITAGEADARAAALGGRAPFIWDNYPVNDALMADRLYLGPLRGRDPHLGASCSGYAANPTVQPYASLPALASIAAYLRGDDADAGWAAAVDELDVRVVAEACDGERPNVLVRSVIASAHDGDGDQWSEPLRALSSWLRDAAKFDPASAADDGGDHVGLRDALLAEAAPWIERMKDEANVGRAAVRVLQAIRPIVRVDDAGAGIAAAPDNAAAIVQALAITYLWPGLRRHPLSVMGPRLSFRSVIEQWPDGTWRFRAASVSEDQNAVDSLIRHAFAALDRFDNDPGLVVTVDGAPVELDADGRFDAPIGSVVRARSGSAVTTVVAPSAPPLDDHRLPRN